MRRQLVRWSVAIWIVAVMAAGAMQVAHAQSRSARGNKPLDVARPADYRSEHFYLHTDLPADRAHQLLGRLETMLGLISDYWGRPLSGLIECYVVEDLKHWTADALHPDGLEKIAQGAGVTISQTLATGSQFVSKSTVYAVADHGTPQHEAVHAYCMQTFGTVGPIWYSEGMAEMGNYWQANDSSVHIEDEVLQHLRQSEPKSLNEIVNQRQKSGDSWQNYAWRWALCHLLANNTNYASEFRPLGLALLTRQNTSFEEVYGDKADQISFEYLQFLKCLENGYRADLCSWDWTKRFVALKNRPLSARVLAARGWQPTGATLASGERYQYTASGKWSVAAGAETNADGDADGLGQLVGALFKDYELGEPFALGTGGTLTAAADGQLYVRCQEAWGELADNKGQITLKIKQAKR
jgi:hypothetical protein